MSAATPTSPTGPPDEMDVRWGYVWLAWAAVALVFGSQNVVGALAAGTEIAWDWAVYHEALYWAVWAAFTPLVVGWARRHRLGADAGWRPWAAHAAMAAVLAPVHIALAYGVHGASLVAIGSLQLAELPGWLGERRAGFLVIALTGIWKYAVVVGVYYAFDYYRRWRREEEQAAALAVRAARLEGQLARSRLVALRSQLRPHFLFNTLNTIGVLVREDPDRAEATIRRLSGLLRQTLERRDTEQVLLAEELSFLERYLDIQRTRYEERLEVEIDVDAETRDLTVPFLILQPLVENAVGHGVDGRPEGGIVIVRARRDGDRLRLSVEDRPRTAGHGAAAGRAGAAVTPDVERPRVPAGPGGAPASDGRGTGLTNVRERLRQLFGDEHRFEAGPRPDGGFTVVLEVPVRRVGPRTGEA